MSQKKFWKTIPLAQLNKEQWESLCDGCGKCCVLKLEDIDTGDVHYTDVGCKLLNCQTARCTKYAERKKYVPDCVILTPSNLGALNWMPESCAYKLVHESKELPLWHPLMTGDPKSTITAGQSVATRVIPENSIDENDLPDHIKKW
ncbi:YcgN family cysteine cluster protein [Candidatus Puniceispirillum sp.]|nr:YcgN family cysteine cluster protein [Candidatus Puniceispirillum sp.]